MKAETIAELNEKEICRRAWRASGPPSLVGKEDCRPVTTCECGRWGSPCPPFLWPEKAARMQTRAAAAGVVRPRANLSSGRD